MLGEKAFFTTINQVVMRNLQTYGMTVKLAVKTRPVNRISQEA